MFPSLVMGHRQHIERVFVVGILVANEAEVRDCLVVPAAVDRQRRGVEAFLDGLRASFAWSGLALANVEVEPDAFVEDSFSSGY